jgi:hypothetical protein
MKSDKFRKRSQFKTQLETRHANELNNSLRILARIIARVHAKKKGIPINGQRTHFNTELIFYPANFPFYKIAFC